MNSPGRSKQRQRVVDGTAARVPGGTSCHSTLLLVAAVTDSSPVQQLALLSLAGRLLFQTAAAWPWLLFQTAAVPDCCCLAVVHRREIVHRDLKLENLLLVRKGDISHIKIAGVLRCAVMCCACCVWCGCVLGFAQLMRQRLGRQVELELAGWYGRLCLLWGG